MPKGTPGEMMRKAFDAALNAIRITESSTAISGGGEGLQEVAAAATPEQLVGVSTPCVAVIVTAQKANTGAIAYGFSNAVRATDGAEVGAILQAGESVALPIDDVQKVWIDAEVNGEGVSFTYLTAS